MAASEQIEDAFDTEEFDADEFVERLAWRTSGGGSRPNPNNFDPIKVHDAFEKAIKDLKGTSIHIQRQVERLEGECAEEVKVNQLKSQQLFKHNQAAFTHFQALDERINFVATKVVHLGDQLEGVNTPRTRAAEALLLIKYFSEFMTEAKPKSDLFTDPAQLQPAADVIQKLFLIAQELPINSSFDIARRRITAQYEDIERQLLQEFQNAHHDGQVRSMKRLATILSHFRGYNKCVEIFIEQTQKHSYKRPDIYLDIPALCERSNTLIVEVFPNPDTVMAKLVHHIYTQKIQKHLDGQMHTKADLEKYLQNLSKFYQKTLDLNEQLSVYKMCSDASYLGRLTKQIFSKYVDSYLQDETAFLRAKNEIFLQRYYDSKSHQKKNIQSGGIHEFRRDLQELIGTKANLNLGPTIENFGGETFLSQEVAINILQESKLAFKRCKLLSSRVDLAFNACRVFDLLVQYLCLQHIDYALELGLQAVPLPDAKTEPEIYFYDVVGQANTIFHLFEKQFTDSLLPLVSSSPKHSECLQRKREIMESMENKVDQGLDRTVAAMAGWIKHILASEQKKSDFKPEESEEGPMAMFSPACQKVVKYVQAQLDAIHFGLDGKNVDAVLTEFGIRLHRAIYDHLLQFNYNSLGALLVICDMNEYRKSVKDFHIPIVIDLFDTLHALCNLLVVKPESLKEVCRGERLVCLDKSILHAFVQLRADYKTARLAYHFR